MGRKIIYIAGYSRSGSTLLDIVLGSSKHVFSTGELVYLQFDKNNGFPCTCGQKLNDCDVYKRVFEISDFEKIGKLQEILEQRQNFNALAAGHLDKDGADYGVLFTKIYNKIFASDQEIKVIVDSSKSAKDACGRALALSKYTDFDVYVLHLTRNCLDVVWSYLKNGSNWVAEGKIKPKRFQVSRSIIGWKLANDNALRLENLVEAKKYMRMSYEDFVEAPQSRLREIEDFSGIDLSDVINTVDNNGDFFVQHLVGGNRMRKDGSVKLRKNKSITRSKSLPWVYKFLYFLIARSTNKKLGY